MAASSRTRLAAVLTPARGGAEGGVPLSAGGRRSSAYTWPFAALLGIAVAVVLAGIAGDRAVTLVALGAPASAPERPRRTAMRRLSTHRARRRRVGPVARHSIGGGGRGRRRRPARQGRP